MDNSNPIDQKCLNDDKDIHRDMCHCKKPNWGWRKDLVDGSGRLEPDPKIGIFGKKIYWSRFTRHCDVPMLRYKEVRTVNCWACQKPCDVTIRSNIALCPCCGYYTILGGY